MLNNSKLQTFLAIAPLALMFACILGYFVFFFSLFANGNLEQMENKNELPTNFVFGMIVFVIFFFLAVILSTISWIYFLIHAVKNPNFEGTSSSMRIVWILVIVLVGGLGNFIYWIAEIKSKNPKPIIPG